MCSFAPFCEVPLPALIRSLPLCTNTLKLTRDTEVTSVHHYICSKYLKDFGGLCEWVPLYGEFSCLGSCGMRHCILWKVGTSFYSGTVKMETADFFETFSLAEQTHVASCQRDVMSARQQALRAFSLRLRFRRTRSSFVY